MENRNMFVRTTSPATDAPAAIVTPVLIAQLAYHIWERSGRPDPCDACWAQAERELRSSGRAGQTVPGAL